MAFSGGSPGNQEPFQALSEFDRTWKKIPYHLHWYVFFLVLERGKTKQTVKVPWKKGGPFEINQLCLQLPDCVCTYAAYSGPH